MQANHGETRDEQLLRGTDNTETTVHLTKSLAFCVPL